MIALSIFNIWRQTKELNRKLYLDFHSIINKTHAGGRCGILAPLCLVVQTDTMSASGKMMPSDCPRELSRRVVCRPNAHMDFPGLLDQPEKWRQLCPHEQVGAEGLFMNRKTVKIGLKVHRKREREKKSEETIFHV